MKVTLKDGSVKQFDNTMLAIDIAKSISEGLARNALAVSVNGKLVGLNEPISEDCTFEVHTFKDEIGKEVYRHTCSHVLAQA
ncbi:MAG: TGS domain-containing protein, partial [Clostridia bacterium]|nr:TGS domain-containing protein [Clostridia bacterium]